jgi:hypothetical protein
MHRTLVLSLGSPSHSPSPSTPPLQVGKGRVDLTIGSALDIFGGEVAYDDVVAWQRRQESEVEGA